MSGRTLYLDTTRLYCAAALLVAVPTLVCATRAISEDTCMPAFAIGDVHFSEMQPPTLSRTWSAVVSVDASHCPAKATGTFDIVFIREKETAPDLEFRERFVWRAPSVKIQVDFDRDEAVQSYRIDSITSCVCGG